MGSRNRLGRIGLRVRGGAAWALAAWLGWITVACVSAQPRIYLAADDHTDFIWSDTEANYTQHFLKMLDFHLSAAETDVSNAVPARFQARFNTDGAYWLWIYERHRSAAQFSRLLDHMKSGHIDSPMTSLCVTYGGMPAEAVLRSMYYAGRLERRFGHRFEIAQTMENMTMPYGLVSLWAGAGAKFSWNGVCDCATAVPGAYNRPAEIYRWRGPDGRSMTMKWYSLVGGNQGIGGYSEARSPGGAIAEMAGTWANRYRDVFGNPFTVKGAFGQGWDDLLTTNLLIRNYIIANDSPGQPLYMSNQRDFFADFETTHGSGLTNFNASFGNEWDVQPASLAEVSASVKRDVELLRSAEALATLVSLKNPAFMSGREAARDLAFMGMGLYFEHDFGDGGPGATAAERRAFQKRVRSEIHAYVTNLFADAKLALAGLIATNGSSPRFFAFNPLGWARTDFADLPYTNASAAHVMDLSTGAEVPSQVVTNFGARFLRIWAANVPSLGYKVFEVVPGAGASFTNPFAINAATGQLENDRVALTVATRGSIAGFVDKTRGNRQFRGAADLNLLGSATGGTLTVENAGPVSATLKAVSTATLPHTTRLTLFRDSGRVDIANEITANFGSVQRWQFSFNLTNVDTWHEEVGAITRARLTTAGGHYSPSNARYDFLTLNHFADMTGTLDGAGPFGITLANADTYFMQLGSSTTTTLDADTPSLAAFAGGQLGGFGCAGQDGDSYFLQRFALGTHDGFDPASAMRFALEHQNPLVCALVTGASHSYPGTNFSFGAVADTNILVWSLKPAEEGITNGVILRVWNHATNSASLAFTPTRALTNAARCTHLETDLGAATVTNGTLSAPLNTQQMETFRLFLPGGDEPPATNRFALRFHGTGSGQQDRVRIPIDDNVNLATNASTPCDVGAGSFSIEFWCRGTLAGNSSSASAEGSYADERWIEGNVIVDRDIWGDSARDWGISIAGGRVRFGTGAGDGPGANAANTIEGGVNVLDGAWHHVACVRDAGTGAKRIYVDGVLDFSSPDGVSTANLSYPDQGVANPATPWGPYIVLAAEKHDAGSAYPSFDGWFDELRVWHTARTGAEIAGALNQILPAGTPGLVGYYRFEEGSGTVVHDSSGAGSPPGELIAGVPGNGEWALASRATFNQPPSVAITAPTNGASFTPPANIFITASAGDADGSVTQVVFFAGATLLDADAASPFGFNWSEVGAGSYTLRAVAYDNLGAMATSAVVNITVGTVTNSPPTVTLTAPANGNAFSAPASINLAATVSDADGSIAQVAFYNGAALLGVDSSSPYTLLWNNVAAGNYSLSAVATDNLGASASSAVAIISVTNPPAASCPFPSTPVLDNFNRANGPLGANWAGSTGGYAIAGNQLNVGAGDLAIYWQGATFGSNQEAFVTLSTVDVNASEIDLMLKVQGSTWSAGSLELWYQAANGVVEVWTYTPEQNWVQHGADVPVTFQNGDRFGCRAKSDGTVEVYRNSTLVGSASVGSWPLNSAGGRIGVWMINASAAVLDDFGGGDVNCCACTATTGPPLAIQWTGTNAVLLSFPADACCSYSLLSQTNIAATNWSAVASFPLRGTNSVITTLQPLSLDSQRYFRLVSPGP